MMAVSYELNHDLTECDGVPWVDAVGAQPQTSHDWAHTLPDGNTVWGRVLRAVRIGTGTTQEQLANRLGVGVRTIHNWETGRTVPSKRKARIYWQQIAKTK